jgi:hypothetical protein
MISWRSRWLIYLQYCLLDLLVQICLLALPFCSNPDTELKILEVSVLATSVCSLCNATPDYTCIAISKGRRGALQLLGTISSTFHLFRFLTERV